MLGKSRGRSSVGEVDIAMGPENYQILRASLLSLTQGLDAM